MKYFLFRFFFKSTEGAQNFRIEKNKQQGIMDD